MGSERHIMIKLIQVKLVVVVLNLRLLGVFRLMGASMNHVCNDVGVKAIDIIAKLAASIEQRPLRDEGQARARLVINTSARRHLRDKRQAKSFRAYTFSRNYVFKASSQVKVRAPRHS